jgi:hypothetical protein
VLDPVRELTVRRGRRRDRRRLRSRKGARGHRCAD